MRKIGQITMYITLCSIVGIIFSMMPAFIHTVRDMVVSKEYWAFGIGIGVLMPYLLWLFWI